jgi:hypothetical protein
MSHTSKLSEWRENIRLKEEQDKIQGRIDCKDIADAILERLIKEPFGIRIGYYHFVDIMIHRVHDDMSNYMNTGLCEFSSFHTIMQARCQATFGEKCVVDRDSNSWKVGYHAHKKWTD